MPAMQTSSAELFQACATIFGPEIKISYDFLKYLQPVGIKTAYRKKAFELHPDRNSDQHAEQLFRELNEAYALLTDADKRRNYDSKMYIHFFTKELLQCSSK